MDYVNHLFMPGHTIEAVIKLKVGHHLTKSEVKAYVEAFNLLNGGVLPRPGMSLKVPISLVLVDGEGSETD